MWLQVGTLRVTAAHRMTTRLGATTWQCGNVQHVESHGQPAYRTEPITTLGALIVISSGEGTRQMALEQVILHSKKVGTQ